MVFDSMLTFVSIIITSISIILAIKYRRKFNLTYWIGLAASLATLGLALFTLGLAIGFFVMILIVAVAFVGYGFQLYMEWESIFVDIALRCSIKKDEAQTLTQEIYKSSKAGRAVGLINTSKAIQKLANRKRTINEIGVMIPHILIFSVAHNLDVVKASDDIDMILRRIGYAASETQRVVNDLTAADLKSPATVEELIDLIRLGNFTSETPIAAGTLNVVVFNGCQTEITDIQLFVGNSLVKHIPIYNGYWADFGSYVVENDCKIRLKVIFYNAFSGRKMRETQEAFDKNGSSRIGFYITEEGISIRGYPKVYLEPVKAEIPK